MCRLLSLVMLLSSSVLLSNGSSSSPVSDACDRLEREVSLADRHLEILHPPPLVGKWVSQRCEVRSGPEFLLRSHSFFANQTFRLTEFHYGDEACSLPLYSVTARGRYSLRGRSWLNPGATDAEYSLVRVTVTAHSAEVAEELAARVNSTCPGQVRRRWKPYREYVVLSLPADWSSASNLPPVLAINSFRKRNSPSANSLGRSLKLMSTEDVNCLSALHAVFHEVQLVRVQSRPPGPPDSGPLPRSNRSRLELLLGDIHSRPGQRNTYRPTAFQTPLLRADKAEGCEVCHAVARGWSRSPPQLLSQPRLPPLLDGRWVSARCETRPIGLFLTRRLHVMAHRWTAFYRFYSDPTCSQPTLEVTATGHLTTSPSVSRVQGAADLDLHVEQATLTPLDPGLATSLQRDHRCGIDTIWHVGVPQDVTPWHGCPALGIAVPSVQYELARVEISPWGTPLLLLGQADTDNAPRGPLDRPTAYQPPLVQCDGDLPPLTHFLGQPQPSSYRSAQPVTHGVSTLLITTLTLTATSLALCCRL